MTSQKHHDTRQVSPRVGGGKSWKRKTPEEVVFAQEEKLRAEIAQIEEHLNQKRVQLKKFEQARRIFEAQ